MLKLVGNEIWRGGEKIGWIDDHHIRAHDDRKLGYFEGSFIYGEDGHKLAYVEGDYLIAEGGDSKTSLEKVSEDIIGGVIPEIGRAAIYMLLGG